MLPVRYPDSSGFLSGFHTFCVTDPSFSPYLKILLQQRIPPKPRCAMKAKASFVIGSSSFRDRINPIDYNIFRTDGLSRGTNRINPIRQPGSPIRAKEVHRTANLFCGRSQQSRVPSNTALLEFIYERGSLMSV